MKRVILAMAMIFAQLISANAAQSLDEDRRSSVSHVDSLLDQGVLKYNQNSVRTRPVRVAQDITEKEAFDLAKGVGTIDGWEAFLIKFPVGYRAQIAKSYLKKLKEAEASPTSNGTEAQPIITQPATSLTSAKPGKSYYSASDFPGYYKIASSMRVDRYLNVERGGYLIPKSNSLPRSSSRWSIEPAPGTGDSPYVLIRNRYLGSLLYLSNGQISAIPGAAPGFIGAHWALEKVPGSTGIIVRNKTNRSFALSVDNGTAIYFNRTNEQAPAAQWYFELDGTDEGSGSSNVGASFQPRIQCSGGTVRSGKCRCRSGRKRVRRSKNNYKCVQQKRASGNKSTCYAAGCGGCGGGFVRIKGQCMFAPDAPCPRGKRRNSYGDCVRKKKRRPSEPASCFESGCSRICGPGKMRLRKKCYTMERYYQLLEEQEG